MSGSQVVPFPMTQWSGSMPAGCCPPGGMDALLQCYCDIQAATAFISKVVTDLAANDPAFQQALADAIAASGSNLPLVGVTNGSDAQPGQVGEFVKFTQQFPYPTTSQTQNVTMGVLQPGDWDIWADGVSSTAMQWMQFNLNPQPAGVSDSLFSIMTILTGGPVADEGDRLLSPVARASLAVPTLFAMTVVTNINIGPSAGTFTLNLNARRRR